MRKQKTIRLFTVRNHLGQFIATYYAHTPEQAISRLIADQAGTAAGFRKSQPLTVRREDFTASAD